MTWRSRSTRRPIARRGTDSLAAHARHHPRPTSLIRHRRSFTRLAGRKRYGPAVRPSPSMFFAIIAFAAGSAESNFLSEKAIDGPASRRAAKALTNANGGENRLPFRRVARPPTAISPSLIRKPLSRAAIEKTDNLDGALASTRGNKSRLSRAAGLPDNRAKNQPLLCQVYNCAINQPASRCQATIFPIWFKERQTAIAPDGHLRRTPLGIRSCASTARPT